MLTAEEKVIITEVNFSEPALLLNRFENLIRQSGSEDEKQAAYYVAERLKEIGIPFEILWPEIYLSTPKRAELKVIGYHQDIRAKTPAYSMSTDDKWVDGELVYASSINQPFAWGDLEYRLDFAGDTKGKIVICEGIPSPDKVREIVNNGGVAAIFVQAGEQIHEGICTTIWGTPELDDFKEIVKIPVVSINNPDGKNLIKRIKDGKVRAAIKTSLEEGWKTCPLVLAKIPGNKEIEKFILLHGHIDSWHAGIGDNALGCATLLEVARVLYQNRQHLRRSVWIAWWPGHSTGRFAGSAWFADHFALDVSDNCIAHVNCESTGCINAYSYEEMTWTEDVHDFCKELVSDITGEIPVWKRPIRAGDYSFHNIGVSSFFMLSSTIGKLKQEELRYHEVYGCGGNIEWHTEDDDLRMVDEKIFLKDTRLYLAGVFRMANACILPIDCRKLLDSMKNYLQGYSKTASESFDWDPVFLEINRLEYKMNRLYDGAAKIINDETKQEAVNHTILKLARKLIRISYTSKPEFSHDPAAMVPPIPDLAPVLKMQQLSPIEQKFLRTQLIRGRNRVCHTLKECGELIDRINPSLLGCQSIRSEQLLREGVSSSSWELCEDGRSGV